MSAMDRELASQLLAKLGLPVHSYRLGVVTHFFGMVRKHEQKRLNKLIGKANIPVALVPREVEERPLPKNIKCKKCGWTHVAFSACPDPAKPFRAEGGR